MSRPSRAGVSDLAAPGGQALDVRSLRVTTGPLRLVSDVSFSLWPGERVGLIGESGSGKSLTALALMGLLPEGLSADGEVRLAGADFDLVGASERQLARVRGEQMAMGFQEPMTALNPVMLVGDQVAEVIGLHGHQPDRRSASRAAVEMLAKVRLPDPDATARAYPHQLSGGQRQRVVLAIALANDPAVLLCDEPTTALDVTVQAHMLELILSGVTERGTALLFITHDLSLLLELADRVAVLTPRPGRLRKTVDLAIPRPRVPGRPDVDQAGRELRDLLTEPLDGGAI